MSKYLPRIIAELEKFNSLGAGELLSREQITKAAAKLDSYASFLPSVRDGSLKEDSALFNFTSKVVELVTRFSPDLTLKDYLDAAVECPSLFYRSPGKIVKNIREVVKRFAPDLTLKDYLDAALDQPQLFYQSPGRIVKNIREVVKRFAPDLTLKDYLDAALGEASLFSQSPGRIVKNIREVVKRFAPDLTLKDYLGAALGEASLFSQSPDTICGHINYIINLCERGIIEFGKRGRKKPGIRENTDFDREKLFKYLCDNPHFLAFSDDNLQLREVYAIKKNMPTSLNPSRKKLEKEMGEMLGRNNLSMFPVDISPARLVRREGEPFTKEMADNMMLRALIRAGIIKSGKLAER